MSRELEDLYRPDEPPTRTRKVPENPYDSVMFYNTKGDSVLIPTPLGWQRPTPAVLPNVVSCRTLWYRRPV